ncbi:hypothetical protein BASA81_002185 [Batrachochytrium salamandrivorans]|nr:hypothetical protein BASA81_002185 [Batrachochytrium salamandrivorans]
MDFVSRGVVVPGEGNQFVEDAKEEEGEADQARESLYEQLSRTIKEKRENRIDGKPEEFALEDQEFVNQIKRHKDEHYRQVAKQDKEEFKRQKLLIVPQPVVAAVAQASKEKEEEEEPAPVFIKRKKKTHYLFAHAQVGNIMSRVLPIPIPRVVDGEGSTARMAELCRELGITKVFIVTDAIIRKLGLIDQAVSSLQASGIPFVIFDQVLPDPTDLVCDLGFALYQAERCNGIVCVGGGSVMDCAKLIGAKTTNPLKDSKYFMQTLGLYPFYQIPPFIAVPTTAGTGSETTIAAVISFPSERKKYTLIDPSICPKIAVLDPKLLVGLPKQITAPTGMDALTHAVESFLSPWRTDFTAKYSKDAVRAVFLYLKRSYDNGGDLEARNGMLLASFNAGVAFTRANVSYVHAIAHQLGALYHTPHGEANAIVLPHLLDFYLDTCVADLAELGRVIGLGADKSEAELAKGFVQAVKQLNLDLNISPIIKHFPQGDVDLVATRARNEAHGDTFRFSENPIKYLMDTGYPLAKFLPEADCKKILNKLVDPQANQQQQSKL